MTGLSRKSLDVVVVCHNSVAQLPGLIDALWQQSQAAESAKHLILVDSGSDHTSSPRGFAARQIIELPNVGYGSAANVGVAAATSDWVAVLNPDCRVSHDDLLALASIGELHSAALVGPMLLDEGERPQPPLTSLPGRPWRPEIVDRSLSAERQVREVAALCGAVLVIRRSTFVNLGGFDWDYFLYAEELDLAARLRSAGERVLWVGSVNAVHLGGASSGATVTQAWRRAQSIRSHLRFVKQRFGRVAATVSALAAIARLVVTSPRSLPRMIIDMTRNPRRGIARPRSWEDAIQLVGSSDSGPRAVARAGGN